MTGSPLPCRVPVALVAALSVALTTAPTTLLGQGRTLEVDDLRLEVGVSTPVLSPDGSQAVVTTSTPNYEDNRFDRTLILVDVVTGDMKQITRGEYVLRYVDKIGQLNRQIWFRASGRNPHDSICIN